MVTFRAALDGYGLEQALLDYYTDPITYSLGMADIAAELHSLVKEKQPRALLRLSRSEQARRKMRDMRNHLHSLGSLEYVSIRQIGFIEFMRRYTEVRHVDNSNNFYNLASWNNVNNDRDLISQWGDFRANVNMLCRHVGVDVDELDQPQKTISQLRQLASDSRRILRPLFEENARLRKDLDAFKRINSALQARHTIEKLTMNIPAQPANRSGQPLKGSGDRWQYIWPLIWQEAETDPNSPFFHLRQEAKNRWDMREYLKHGGGLFSEMSSEIHRFEIGNDDYEHFNPVVRDILKALRPIQSNGEVDWDAERKRMLPQSHAQYNSK